MENEEDDSGGDGEMFMAATGFCKELLEDGTDYLVNDLSKVVKIF